MLLKRFPETALLAVLMVLFVLIGSLPVRADCFEVLGCTNSDRFKKADLKELSCENLWYVRNRIFFENGYCFQTARGKAMFDNSSCVHKNQSKVPMNSIERANVAAIKSVEAAKGCS